MLPLITRASQEVIARVPTSLREAADALGVNRWRTITGVVIPEARAGIITGVILAVARAAGETAPLILLSATFNPTQTSSGTRSRAQAICQTSPSRSSISPNRPTRLASREPGALALVLLAMILFANFLGRMILARSAKRTGR